MSEFEFKEGDTVTVRVRDGTTGNICVKFTAECVAIEGTGGFLGHKARFGLPGTMNTVAYAKHEAEFEVQE